jgi:hypothetical protein
VLVGYSRFGAGQYASANYSFRAAGDASGTLRDDTVLKAGVAPYTKDFGSGSVRWGDYSSTVVDPVNDLDMWTIQEYAESPQSTWATWWGRIVPSTLLPSLSIDDVSLREGHSGTKSATFTVTLSEASTSTVTVNYATADATASSGSDYVAAAGSLSFPPGVLTRPIPVTVNGDTAMEPTETFRVNLSAPTNADVADAEGVGSIVNDDFADPSLSGLPIRAVHITELRAAVNAARDEKGLDPFTFTDPALTPQSSVVKAVHVSELRDALAEAYTAAMLSPPTYTDPTLMPTVTTIKAVHIIELREAVTDLP